MQIRGAPRLRAGEITRTVMAFYEVLVQRPWGAPRARVRVRLDDRLQFVEGETDAEGRVVLGTPAPLVELFVDGRSEGLIRPGTTLVTR